jgi:hypothetical protein
MILNHWIRGSRSIGRGKLLHRPPLAGALKDRDDTRHAIPVIARRPSAKRYYQQGL